MSSTHPNLNVSPMDIRNLQTSTFGRDHRSIATDQKMLNQHNSLLPMWLRDGNTHYKTFSTAVSDRNPKDSLSPTAILTSMQKYLDDAHGP